MGPNMFYIFEKLRAHKDAKHDILIIMTEKEWHKYKDTNTQIHCDEVQEIPNMCNIFEKAWGPRTSTRTQF